MSLQALWSLFQLHPAQVINALALFFAVSGSWLLLATRLREHRALARLAGQVELPALDEDASLLDEPTRRINLFFYLFGGSVLVLALMLSWFSTQL